MTDLNSRIGERLDRMADDSPMGQLDSSVRAFRAVLALCEAADRLGNGTPQSVYGPLITQAIARELLGIKEDQ